MPDRPIPIVRMPHPAIGLDLSIKSDDCHPNTRKVKGDGRRSPRILFGKRNPGWHKPTRTEKRVLPTSREQTPRFQHTARRKLSGRNDARGRGPWINTQCLIKNAEDCHCSVLLSKRLSAFWVVSYLHMNRHRICHIRPVMPTARAVRRKVEVLSFYLSTLITQTNKMQADEELLCRTLLYIFPFLSRFSKQNVLLANKSIMLLMLSLGYALNVKVLKLQCMKFCRPFVKALEDTPEALYILRRMKMPMLHTLYLRDTCSLCVERRLVNRSHLILRVDEQHDECDYCWKRKLSPGSGWWTTNEHKDSNWGEFLGPPWYFCMKINGEYTRCIFLFCFFVP